MADNTIILQGQFTSTGDATFIPLRSGVDWMEVINMTEAAAANASHGVEYEWQLGMAVNDGLVFIRNAAATAVDMTTEATLGVDGFTLTDTSVQTLGAPRAFTQITNATPPLVLTANTTGLIAGQTVVRLYFQNGTAPYAEQLAGIDFTVGAVNAGVSFELQNMPAIVATGTPVGGTYSIVSGSGVPYWYPSLRVISDISNAAQAVVSTTVDHGYLVGQQVRFSNVKQVRPGSAAFGMIQINNLTGNIVAVTADTFTVDIDTTGFSPFAFPVTANFPFTPATVIPVGEDEATALSFGVNDLSDATINTAQIGMTLGAGITSPAGSIGDVIFWKAGKSFNV